VGGQYPSWNWRGGIVEREGELREREREREDALLLYSSSKVEELI